MPRLANSRSALIKGTFMKNKKGAPIFCANRDKPQQLNYNEENFNQMYEALKALVDHFRANDENYYKSDLCSDAIIALRKAEGK